MTSDYAADGVVSIWLTPRSEDVQPSLSIEVIGGPKRYLRIWLDKMSAQPEWGWVLHDTAVKLWSR